MGDHTETFQVDYDPARISYEELLDVFWASHSPSRPSYSVQYKAAVFFHDTDQGSAARASLERILSFAGKPVTTEVLPFERFFLAEHYHQKYALRGNRLLAAEFRRFGYGDAMLRESTAAARVNGYLYGVGSNLRLEEEIETFGLSEKAERQLREAAARRR